MTPAARPPARRNGIAAVTTIGPPAELATLSGVQGTLALDLGEVAVHRPAAPTRPALRAVPAQRAEVESFAARFCAAVLEVLAGDRGPAQLLRCTTDEVYADLVRRSQALTQTAGSDQRVRRFARPGAERARVLPAPRCRGAVRARAPRSPLTSDRRPARAA